MTRRRRPVLLHGDAAFPGQGVVAETLNLPALDGYTTGGTIHFIQNNQVGFTTDPKEGRSTPYAADMAKGFNVPIIHVNADDIDACIAAIRLAMAYREHWGRDVVIDVIGYRRYGHNEADEPAYTQPIMAAQIKEHPPVSEIFAERLVSEGVVTQEEVDEAAEERREQLSAALKGLREKIERGEYEDPTRPAGPASSTARRARRSTRTSPRTACASSTSSCSRSPRASPSTASCASRWRSGRDARRGRIEFGHAEASPSRRC